MDATFDDTQAAVLDGSGATNDAKATRRAKWHAHRLAPNTIPASISLGAGDSTLVTDLLPSSFADSVFALLRAEVAFLPMSHAGGTVPRLVAVQGAVDPDGTRPLYRHPSDASPPLLPFSPTVQRVREHVERALGQSVNHCLVQLYRDGNDAITEHADKTLDIAHASAVANVSFGALRIMRLRRKRVAEVGAKRDAQAVPLPHNSLFVLGPRTNREWLHAIRPDGRREAEKSKEEVAQAGQRISLTFRQVHTFVDPAGRWIWGQGATGKTREERNPVLPGAGKEGEALLMAYKRDNTESEEFVWEEVYGRGSDVVDLGVVKFDR